MDHDVVVCEQPDAAADLRTRDGFEAWVWPHWSAMANFATRLVGSADGEDVVQDALAVAWRKRNQFDISRGSARSWLLALVADQARQLHRRTRRRGRRLMRCSEGTAKSTLADARARLHEYLGDDLR